jgi:hypothetical protein
MGKKSEQPGSYFLELRNHVFGLKTKILRYGSGMEKIRTRDPGWKKIGSGINIPDPQHWLHLIFLCAKSLREILNVLLIC